MRISTISLSASSDSMPSAPTGCTSVYWRSPTCSSWPSSSATTRPSEPSLCQRRRFFSHRHPQSFLTACPHSQPIASCRHWQLYPCFTLFTWRFDGVPSAGRKFSCFWHRPGCLLLHWRSAAPREGGALRFLVFFLSRFFFSNFKNLCGALGSAAAKPLPLALRRF